MSVGFVRHREFYTMKTIIKIGLFVVVCGFVAYGLGALIKSLGFG